MLQFALFLATANLALGLVQAWRRREAPVAPPSSWGAWTDPDRWSGWARDVVAEAGRPWLGMLPVPGVLRAPGPTLWLLPGSAPPSYFWPLARRLQREGYQVRLADGGPAATGPSDRFEALRWACWTGPPAPLWIAFGEAGQLAAHFLRTEAGPRPNHLITLGTCWDTPLPGLPSPPTWSDPTSITDIQGCATARLAPSEATFERIQVPGAGRLGLLWSVRTVNLVTRQVKSLCSTTSD